MYYFYFLSLSLKLIDCKPSESKKYYDRIDFDVKKGSLKKSLKKNKKMNNTTKKNKSD
jgi:hypothetical protein